MPKASNTDIFDLIKSLTTQEKRFFTSSFRSNSRDFLPIHLRLFAILNLQKEYDEKEICKKLQVNKLRYANIKKYLYKSILHSIRSFYTDKGYKSHLRELFDDYDILYNKNLYGQAEKVILKAIEISNHYELHSYAMEGYKNLFHLKNEEGDMKWIEKHGDQLFKDIEQRELRFSNLITYIRNESSIVQFLSKYGDVIRSDESKKAFLKMKASLRGLDRESQAMSEENRMRFNFQRGVIAYLNKDPRSSVNYFLKAKRVFERDPSKIKFSFRGYLSLIGNIFNVGMGRLPFSELQKNLVNIGAFRKYWLPENHEVISSYYTNLLFLHHSYHKYKEAMGVMEEVNSWAKKTSPKEVGKKLLYVYFYEAVCYFYNGSFDNALFYMNKIMNAPISRQSISVNSTIRIVNLIIHYEKGSDSELLNSLIRSSKRFILKHKTGFETEEIMLDFFNRSLKSGFQNKELLIEFKKLKTKVNRSLSTAEGKWVQKEFDYLYWIDKKIASVK